ncbi:hypothetical protein J2W25_004640 [Variovorax boronicumulans]|uniref:DUF932 domain-containing protein n=1 Tax=Variovorax boronicumulans TaxID=436515 RepID=A0AAW8E192_9BURK|nr:DUF932 domain-containing protein [Variovorax boronicumulans]MDP9880311.1 hypothetical protein [Variovorax boronicumulans]MDP9925597.1 hypothetical protein [Variovorax boronicumulans]
MSSLNEQTAYEASMNEILDAADLNWVIIKAPADTEAVRSATTVPAEAPEQSMLLRSDNQERLSIVPSTHQPWQPREVLDFYFALAAFYGWALERVGHVRGGRRLWGLLNTGERIALPGGFSATMHVLASTRCDSPLAAQAGAVCVLEPGGIVLPATPGSPTEARIARSFEFLTPGDLAEIGELVLECTSFPVYLAAFSSRGVSSDEICKATAAAYSSRRGGDDVPSPAALKAITRALGHPSGEANALDLLHALVTLSDTRNRKRWGQDFRGAAWFGTGLKRKQRAVQALARMLGASPGPHTPAC